MSHVPHLGLGQAHALHALWRRRSPWTPHRGLGLACAPLARNEATATSVHILFGREDGENK